MEKRNAANFGNKNVDTRNESYKKFIQTLVSEEGEKFLKTAKNDALKADKTYMALKAQLKKKETEIVSMVTNKFWAHKLAIGFGQRWKIDAEVLENLMINEEGVILREGKPYAIATIANASSYMVYLEDSMTRSYRKKKDLAHEIYIEVKGGMEWLPLDAVCDVVAKKRNMKVSDILEYYKQFADKEE